jgi:hypothetical protein
MAEFEKTEFEFPDEVESKQSKMGSKLVAVEDPLEIEIVDDTPESDRNVKPLPEPPEEVTEEELSRYSDKRLKERLAHLGKGYHDERRAKEAAAKEKDEALRIARAVVEENKQLKGSLSTSQEALLTQAKKVVATDLEKAKIKYKQAYESGDADAFAEAAEALTASKLTAERVNNFRQPSLQEDKNSVQLEQLAQTTSSDPKAEAWKQANNSWFGKDREMTGYAFALHEKLVVEDGIDPTSDEYYKKLNGRIRQVFPEKFASGESADAPNSQRPKANIVAPATRSTAPRKIVLNPTQVQLAKKLGVPLELYAKKVAEEMRK